GKGVADGSERGQFEVVGGQGGERRDVARVEQFDRGGDEAAFAGVGVAYGPVFPGDVAAGGDGQVGDGLAGVADPQVGVAVPGRDGDAVAVLVQGLDDRGERTVGGTSRDPAAGRHRFGWLR